MKRFFSVLTALCLIAGTVGLISCGGGPTGPNPGPTPVAIAVTGISVTGRTVGFTITGPANAKAFLPEVRCGSATGPGGTFTQGLPAGYEATGLALGSYSITIPVYTDGGNLVDQLCWGTKGTLHVAQGGTTWVFEAEVKWAPAP